ncbi:hypothetical protein ONZ45_g12358 [Pleurotus djamor]|nr:hypothetical protein ONZ45_g12358 [Pleurotus djamor]
MCLASFTGDASYVGKPAPSLENLDQSDTALLRFVLTDSLYASPDPAHPTYRTPVLDPYTGIRSRANYWFKRARFSQVVILNRAPVPAPTWSYDGTPQGNWSFISGYTPATDLGPAKPKVLDRQSHGLILDAALNVTISTFLPSVLPALRRIRRQNISRSSIMIWHGNWFVNPSCDKHGQHRGLRSKNVEDLALYAIEDPWVLYYNAQVYIQDIVLAELLPIFNITYLPMSIPLDSRATGHSGAYGACLTYPLGSVGADAIASTFFGGLQHILRSTTPDDTTGLGIHDAVESSPKFVP